MVEQFSWTLGHELAKQCTGGQFAWDQKLPALLMTYRSVAHETTGHSPAKLMFERELRLPVDLLTGRPPGEGLPPNVSSFARRLEERLEEVYHQVRGSLKFSGEVMKRGYDVKANYAAFQGRRPGLGLKLEEEERPVTQAAESLGVPVYRFGAPLRRNLQDQTRGESQTQDRPRQPAMEIPRAR